MLGSITGVEKVNEARCYAAWVRNSKEKWLMEVEFSRADIFQNDDEAANYFKTTCGKKYYYVITEVLEDPGNKLRIVQLSDGWDKKKPRDEMQELADKLQILYIDKNVATPCRNVKPDIKPDIKAERPASTLLSPMYGS